MFLKIQIAKESHIAIYICIYIYTSYTHFGFPKNDSEKKQLDASGPGTHPFTNPKPNP